MGCVSTLNEGTYLFDKPLGRVAQLVEQWTENPCVGGSSPPPTTSREVALGRKSLQSQGLRSFSFLRFVAPRRACIFDVKVL
jgi:hypothetical protein